MSRDDEEGGVSGAGLVLGAGAATGAAYVGDQMLSKQMVEDAWKGKQGVNDSVLKKVKSFFGRNSKLADQRDAINAFNALSEPDAKIDLLDPKTASQMESPAITTASDRAKNAEKLYSDAVTAKNAGSPIQKKISPQQLGKLQKAVDTAEANLLNAQQAGKLGKTQTKAFKPLLILQKQT